MKQSTQFKSENIMMSVLGHLILLAVMFASFSVVVERAKLVTPNRIQIVEIDLKDVKVSGQKLNFIILMRLIKKKKQKLIKKAGTKKIYLMKKQS